MNKARPSDLLALQTEIQQLWANMTETHMTPIAVLLITPQVPMVDLFFSNDPTHSSLGRRPCTDEDPMVRHVHVRRLAEEDLELALRESSHDEEMRWAQATE